MACQCKITHLVRSAMLFGGDVFNVVGKIAVFLAEQAVLATAGRPLPDELPRPGIHQITCNRGTGAGEL
jgi:hypothetical protein